MAFRRAGQSSVEFIAIIGVSLIITIIFLVLSSNLMTGYSVQQNYDDAYRSVQALAQAADAVYAQGEGASQTVAVTLPTNTDFSPGKTFIGRPPGSTASPNMISINVNGTDIFAITEAPLSGSFPQRHGTYRLKVACNGTGATIAPYLVEPDRRSVRVSAAAGERREASVRIYNEANESVSLSASLPWAFPDVAASLAPSSAGALYEGTPFHVNFSAAANASGVYSSTLQITATGASSGLQENITMPVTVIVNPS
jgi:hypothetical protein